MFSSHKCVHYAGIIWNGLHAPRYGTYVIPKRGGLKEALSLGYGDLLRKKKCKIQEILGLDVETDSAASEGYQRDFLLEYHGMAEKRDNGVVIRVVVQILLCETGSDLVLTMFWRARAA